MKTLKDIFAENEYIYAKKNDISIFYSSEGWEILVPERPVLHMTVTAIVCGASCYPLFFPTLTLVMNSI